MKIKPAKHLFNLFLKTTRYSAITMPWGTVYVLPEHLNNKGLLAHEGVHVDQIAKHGAIKFTILYLWYNLKYGYWNNPFEVEARKISGHH